MSEIPKNFLRTSPLIDAFGVIAVGITRVVGVIVCVGISITSVGTMV